MKINLKNPLSCQTTRVDETKVRWGAAPLTWDARTPLPWPKPLISFHLQASLPHATVATVTGAGRAISPGRRAPRGRGRPTSQQVGGWKDERAININSPPFCVLKYLILLGRSGAPRAEPERIPATRPLLFLLNEGLVRPRRRSCSRGTGVSKDHPPPFPTLAAPGRHSRSPLDRSPAFITKPARCPLTERRREPRSPGEGTWA